jgi:1A family penicillin-binding protein
VLNGDGRSQRVEATQEATQNAAPPTAVKAQATQKSEAQANGSSMPAPPRRRRRRLLLGTIMVAAVASLVAATWWGSCGWEGCPTPADLRAWRPTEGGSLMARDSSVISALAPVKRLNVSLARVPSVVQSAFIAVEDRRFRTHHGVDWYGVARAVVRNVRAAGVREGASTITMQLARNVFLGNRATERSWSRKLLEWRYAGLLEQALSKDEILERYLNAIYMGNGVYGIEAASRDLFGKHVSDLTLADAAMLAGLPKAPSTYSPRNSRRRALARRAVVLDILEREGVASAAAIRAARRAGLSLARAEWHAPRSADSWAVESARETLDSLRTAGIIPRALNDAQLRVWSTIDRRAQVAAERAVANGAAMIDDERAWSGVSPRGANRTQGALVAIDPATGAVRAIVGGRRMERRGFNRALRAQRQPGSTFKPFVYAAALQQGFTTATVLEDEPVEVGSGRDIWRPANYGDEYAGRVTLRQALTRSANAATVRLSRTVGVPRIAALARAQGIESSLPLVPALALGAGAVTPIELTTAYAPFANGGHRVRPFVVERVEDPFGRLLWQRPVPTATTVLPAADAFLVTSLLQSVVDEGTGRAVRDAGIQGPVAGKTGTTNDGTDVWFVGYTPTLVAGLWFGTDTPQPLGGNASGGRLAAPIWGRFLRDGWHSPTDDVPWQAPPNIETRQIDEASGMLADEWCGPARREYFKKGSAPTERCEGQSWIAMDEHDDAREAMPTDAELLAQVMRGVLDATNAGARTRDRASRISSELLRALEREAEKLAREQERRPPSRR